MENQIEFPAKCLIAGLKRHARPMLKGIEYLAGQRASAKDLESCLVCIVGGGRKRGLRIIMSSCYTYLSLATVFAALQLAWDGSQVETNPTNTCYKTI